MGSLLVCCLALLLPPCCKQDALAESLLKGWLCDGPLEANAGLTQWPRPNDASKTLRMLIAMYVHQRGGEELRGGLGVLGSREVGED